MRKLSAILIALFALAFASPAVADTSALINGINGAVTSPFDIVMGAVEGKHVVDLGPLDPIGDRVTGALFGVKDAGVRAGTGAFDAATFLITAIVGGPYSPDARFDFTAPIVKVLIDIGLIDAEEEVE